MGMRMILQVTWGVPMGLKRGKRSDLVPWDAVPEFYDSPKSKILSIGDAGWD